MRMRAGLVAVLVTTVASACSSGSVPAPKPAAKDAVRSVDPAKATELTLDRDLTVIAELPQKVGKQHVYFSTFTQDGKLLGSMALPEAPSDVIPGPTTSQSYPFIYDLETKKYTILDKADRPKPTYVDSMASDGDDIAWVEGQGHAIGTSDFAVRSYDRKTEKVTDLAAFSDPDGQIVYGADLAIHEGTAFFSTSAYPKKRRQEAVYAVPLDGSSPVKKLVPGGSQVGVDDGVLTYTKGKSGYSRDLSTGATSTYPVSSHAAEPGFCGAEFTNAFEAWCVGEPVDNDNDNDVADPVLTIKESSGRVNKFGAFPSDSLNYPIPHDVTALGQWIGITMTSDTGADRQFLFDREAGTLSVFPKDSNFVTANSDGSRALLGTMFDDEKDPGPLRVVALPAS